MFPNRSKFLIATFIFWAVAVQQAYGTPAIEKVSGSLKEGGKLVIQGDSFTEKEKDRPYFVWEADKGVEPRSIGRHSKWDREFSGSLTAEIVSPNSERSARFDHGASSGAALAGVRFSSDKLFMSRRTFENFDTSRDYARRTRVENLAGTPKVGQIVRGIKSGATGVIVDIDKDEPGRWAIFYDPENGTINKRNPIDFQYGEPMETDTATFTNAEGTSQYPTGTYRTFNFKTFRMWHSEDKNYAYVGTGRSQGYDTSAGKTGVKLWNERMDVPLTQKPREWKVEELYYNSSDVGRRNGLIDFRHNNVKSYDHRFITRNEKTSRPYNIIYQSQVSNGAQPGSFIYYDYLYLDDSFHHVALCTKATWQDCRDIAIQIPLEWTNDKIKIEFNARHLGSREPLYLYVVDGNRDANQDGFKLCSDCPSSPGGFALQ